MKRTGFLNRVGRKVYDMPRVDKKVLDMKKSFDQVNELVKDIPGGKPKESLDE